MLEFKDLNLGFYDAENYLLRPHKSFFKSIFYRDDNLDRLLSPAVNFLIGEKGTGKTAYAVYLANNEYKNTKSKLKYIRETDYIKFIELKRMKNLDLSDFSSVWKVILLVLISQIIEEGDLDNNFLFRRRKLSSLVEIINMYYDYAFDPEIINALGVVETEELIGRLKSALGEASASSSTSLTINSKHFQIALLKIERNFKHAISDLKLKKNIILFIDGIDIRPGNICYQDYLMCIKGLADAIWSLNMDFFANIRDSNGRIKIVLLVRPDIFNSLALQNDANKAKDNSVLLDWRTTYPEYRKSKIFKLIDKLLSTQQSEELSIGQAWDHYFPWSNESTNPAIREFDPSFISFLRLSYSRPRDIIASLSLLQEKVKHNEITDINSIKEFFQSNEFKSSLSEHILRSIKNQTSFYYTDEEYDILVQFFDFLPYFEFTWEEYDEIYKNYIHQIENLSITPDFVESKEKFLQFLYETNIICYIEIMEHEPMFRWCYRERQISRIAPKVKYGCKYRVHYALHKALNLGHQKRN